MEMDIIFSDGVILRAEAAGACIGGGGVIGLVSVFVLGRRMSS